MKQQIQLTPIKNGILIGTGGTDAVRGPQGQILQPGTAPEITFVGSFEELCEALKVALTTSFTVDETKVTPISG